MAGDAARKRELPEEPLHAGLVQADIGIDLAVGSLEVRVGHHSRAAMARPGHVYSVEVAGSDDAVHVRVDEVEARSRPPVAEEARLDVLGAQRLAQQGIVEQVDLTDREVVRRSPVGVDPGQILVRQRTPQDFRSGAAHAGERIAPACQPSLERQKRRR